MSDNPRCPLCKGEMQPYSSGQQLPHIFECCNWDAACSLNAVALTLAEIERLKAGLTDDQIAAGLSEYQHVFIKSQRRAPDSELYAAFRRGAYADQEPTP